MATTTLRKLLDLKVWQEIAPVGVTNAANFFTVASKGPDQLVYYVSSTTGVQIYDPNEDGWLAITSPALATFAAGAAAAWHPTGPSGTALAGSTSTTLNTNLTLLGDLSTRNGLSFKVRITGGTGAGQQRDIASNTFGANGIVTVSTPWSVTPDNTSTFILYTGRVYVFGGGTLAAGSFKHWDHATQAWSGNLSITGLPSSFGTDGKIAAPNSIAGPTFTGTATSGTATTLVNSAKTWATNQFANWQVRITAGAGAGGIRSITSNTGTTLTINSGTAIDSTSQYSIEPSDDFLYLVGNAAVAMYRYSISGNSWSTLSPGTARSGAPGAALSANWITGVTQSDWTNESAVINGRRIYSFDGGGTNTLDYYDISLNAWTNNITYARANTTITTGASYVYDDGNYIYIQFPQGAGSFTFISRIDLRGPTNEPWSSIGFVSGAATLGEKMWISQYHDGSGTPLKFLYVLQPSIVRGHRSLIW